MSSNVIENLSDPARAKIIMELIAHEKRTAKELMEAFPNLSQTAMSQHLSAMVADGTLVIAGNAYSVTAGLNADAERIVTENDGAGYLQMFSQFIAGIRAEFEDYTAREKINILGDGSGFTAMPVYATTEELQETLVKVSEVLMPLLHNKQSPERNLHNICLITTPPKA